MAHDANNYTVDDRTEEEKAMPLTYRGLLEMLKCWEEDYPELLDNEVKMEVAEEHHIYYVDVTELSKEGAQLPKPVLIANW